MQLENMQRVFKFFFPFPCVSCNLSQINGLVNRSDGLDDLFGRDGSMYCDYLIYNGMLVVSALPDIGALGLPGSCDSVISLLRDIFILDRKAGSDWEKHG